MSDSSKQPSEQKREQLEAHVVAMLLWKTSSFEKAQLQQQIRDDERLAKFCSEIEKTLSLVSDAFDSGQAGKAKRANVRLSRQRRSMLKKHLEKDRAWASATSRVQILGVHSGQLPPCLRCCSSCLG